MKRTQRSRTPWSLLVAVLSVLVALLPDSGLARSANGLDRTDRVVELSYDQPPPAIAVAGLTAGWVEHPMTVKVKPRDRYVRIEVADDSGQKVYGSFSQYRAIAETGLERGDFCGKHTAPVELLDSGRDAEDLVIHLFSGTCKDGSLSLVTSGTVKVTFSNHP